MVTGFTLMPEMSFVTYCTAASLILAYRPIQTFVTQLFAEAEVCLQL